MGKLDGKVAIVTGASKGLGAEMARALAQEGAAVVVNYSSSREGAQRVVKDIEKVGGRAVAVQANLAKPEEVKKLFKETKKALGRLDILVNNAGVYEFLPLEEITPEHFHKHFELNVLGLLLTSQEAVNYFGSQGGSIINVSSLAAMNAIPRGAVYSATKAAVDSITRVLSVELGPRKIRVNSVNPGLIETEGTQAGGVLESDWRKEMEADTPLGRIGKPEDVAPAVVFLASDDASWISGANLLITGGLRH